MVLLIVELETRRRVLCAAKRLPRWHLAISATVLADRIGPHVRDIDYRAPRRTHTVCRRASIDRADLNLHRRCEHAATFPLGWRGIGGGGEAYGRAEGRGNSDGGPRMLRYRLRRSRYNDALCRRAAESWAFDKGPRWLLSWRDSPLPSRGLRRVVGRRMAGRGRGMAEWGGIRPASQSASVFNYSASSVAFKER